MLFGPIPSCLVRGCLPRSAAVFGSRSITPFHSDSGLLVSPPCHEVHLRFRGGVTRPDGRRGGRVVVLCDCSSGFSPKRSISASRDSSGPGGRVSYAMCTGVRMSRESSNNMPTPRATFAWGFLAATYRVKCSTAASPRCPRPRLIQMRTKLSAAQEPPITANV